MQSTPKHGFVNHTGVDMIETLQKENTIAMCHQLLQGVHHLQTPMALSVLLLWLANACSGFRVKPILS